MAEETPPPVEEEPNKQAKKRRSRGNSEDRSRSQRLKTASAAGGRDTGDARNDALERENRALRQQLLGSDAEVARLCQQLQRQNALLRPLLLRQRLRPLQLQESHVALAVTVSTLTMVDLSYIDTSLVAQIASFVGTSRELLNLALTCKYFGRRQWHLGSASELSLVEEVARQAVRCKQNSESFRLSLPEYVRGRVTWLSILHELDATEIQLSVGTPHRTLKR